jgi:4-hydroxy-2-oxoheptanedioate aldolase
MVQINGWMGIPDVYANSVFARAGWDSVTLDAQHGLFDEAAIVRTLLTLSAPKPRRLVRVSWNDPAIIGKVLDAGADGVIVPMINSVDEARRLAEACFYPPVGRRSFGPRLAAWRAGDRPYKQFAAEIDVLAMIETREALDAVDAIASVAGITGLFVGPNDLALALGLASGADREEPQMIEAFRTIIAAASRAGKTAGIYCGSPAYARRMAELGFAMVTVANDAGVLAQGAAAACAAVRAPSSSGRES